jgi:hypothetical protein
MSSISGKINLTQLKNQVITTKKGAKCIVIPIKENNLYEGEKGVYLDITAFENKNKGDRSDTHIVKQSLQKEVYQSMSEEQKKAMPILGNLKVWGSGGYSEPDPNTVDTGFSQTIDDLPF